MMKENRTMNGTEKVVKHLEMTQAVINRLARNSFLLKNWSLTILVAAMVFIAKPDLPYPYFNFVLLIPIMGFWGLDGYFLMQERRFREIYKKIRKQEDTDFEMNPKKHKKKPKCSWISSFFSITLIIFYLVEIAFVVVVFAIVKSL